MFPAGNQLLCTSIAIFSTKPQQKCLYFYAKKKTITKYHDVISLFIRPTWLRFKKSASPLN